MAAHLPACGIVTLRTDFGSSDGYVAAMKGTALSLSPTLRVVDITHEVPNQDIFRAALILKQVAQTFPEGTVHDEFWCWGDLTCCEEGEDTDPETDTGDCPFVCVADVAACEALGGAVVPEYTCMGDDVCCDDTIDTDTGTGK